jgi:glycosyltransferase involved in cell wall biosynthesis
VVGRSLTFAVPGRLDTPTGGYAYDRRVIAELATLGWRVDILEIGEGFPFPDAATHAHAKSMLERASSAAPLVIDGLAFGVMDDIAPELARTHRLIALVHHPLALETGLAPQAAFALRKSERAALVCAQRVIVTIKQTAGILRSDYGVSPDRITVAPPGNDPMSFSPGSSDGICRLLSVGAIVPRKGYENLVAALAQVHNPAWFLTIAGDTTRDADCAAMLQMQIENAGLAARVRLAGAVSDGELEMLYHEADVFVTASLFEGYGMAALTALACGLPLVATRVGALEDIPGDAAIRVSPGDTTALATALTDVIRDADLRGRMRMAAQNASHNLPTWREAAIAVAAAIEPAA